MRISDWSSDVCSSDLHAEQLAMPERLTGRRKTDALRRRLQQIVSSVSLQQSGLLVIAVAVNHAVRMTERAAGVHGIDRGVDARILARRHAGLQAVRHVRQRLLLLGLRPLLVLFFDHTGDLPNAFTHRALAYATHRLAHGDARTLLEPHRMRRDRKGGG